MVTSPEKSRWAFCKRKRASSFTLSGANGVSLQGSAAPVAGTDHGAFSVTAGTFNYGGDLTLDFTGVAADGATYDIFNVIDGSLGSGSFANVFLTGDYSTSLVNDSGVWTGFVDGVTFTFTEATGDLSVSAIPEPSAFAALAGLAGLGFAASRRRRTA